MQDSMMLIKSEWDGKPTFKMIPINKDCPYVECIFDPDSKILAVISNIKKNILHMLPRLDDSGAPIENKVIRPGTKKFKEERKTIETFQEYYITDIEDIKEFVNSFAINKSKLDTFASFFEKKQIIESV